MTAKELVARERERYMAGEITHQAYYCWLSDLIGLYDSLIPASNETIKVSLATDEHLNNIPLQKWDNMDQVVRGIANSHGLPWSPSDTVCCLKAIARRRAERDT